MSNNKAAPSNSSEHAPPAHSVEAKDWVAQEAHSGIDTISTAAHPTIDRLASGAHKVVESADTLLNPAAEALDSATVKGEELIAASAGYMRNHPFIALGLAVTAGYILSGLLASRHATTK